MTFSRMGIGEPKYDSMMQKDADYKRFLFIDSGHYPFGLEGKRELAKTILNICRSFPDYELWIKPRFLPGDEVITHKNDLNIYDVIREEAQGEIPQNLVMLMEHKDLMDLIEQCCTVLCMYTTAFSGAYVAGKGLVVLDNIPSEDVYDVRRKVFDRVREIMLGSGAVIDYKRVNEVLPNGIKCTDDYFQYLLSEKENTADKICEVTEYLFDNFYSKQLFPKIHDCDYRDYKENIRVDDEMTWEKIIGNRYGDVLLKNMIAGIYYNINATLDITIITDCLKEGREMGITEAFFKQMRGRENEYRDKCIVQNRDVLLENEIDSGVLLQTYYVSKQYDEIINFPRQDIGAFHLFRGYVAYEQGKRQCAAAEFEKYLQLSLDRAYIKEVSDMPGYQFSALYLLIQSLAEESEMEKANDYLEKIKDLYSRNYGKRDGFIDRIQGVRYTYVHWAQGAVDNYSTQKEEFLKQPIVVYGAGVVSKEIILKNKWMTDRIVAFIDKFSGVEDLDGIPVLPFNALKDFESGFLIVIAVPHQVSNIKKDILKVRNDMKIVSINDLF